ncbi:MAG: asparagine synthase (glutamine-hydrolyzing) [Planctomycetia bacterium]|nr:asparagine synthase (glutamine-hydrolyzing) [Planctomycetia bacterium]
MEPAVRRMMQAMIHRGPDDDGYEELPMGGDESGPVAGFGFRRLSILDLTSAGHQPIFNSFTGDCLIFNGEIYNFRSLRSELQLRGTLFRGTSDSEVLLQALSTWGEAALEKLQGMYAFAFYEAKTRRILLARDPLGIKPLYVASLPNRFVFASEIRSVRVSGLVPDDLDMGGIAGMLAYGAVQSPRTIYEHIRSFPAGNSQWLDAGVVSGSPQAPSRRYWNFPAHPQTATDVPTAAAHVRQLLHDSVLRHLVADVPVGVFLSAGIDSTIIASCAREFTPQVTAFTVGFGAVHGQDEVTLASETARALGMKHVAVELDANNMPEKWQDWIAGMDSPSIDGFNTYVVSRRLAAEGVVVGLSGLGADELFGGYQTFDRAPRWSKLLRAMSFIPSGMRTSVIRRLGELDGRTGAFEKLADLVAGDPSVAGIALSLRRAMPNRSLSALGFYPGCTGLGVNYLDARSDTGAAATLDGDGFNTVARMEMTHYMGDTLLRDTDTNSMRQSLEVRVPFLDTPVVDYVSSLPGHIKRHARCSSKSLLRMACAKAIRDDVARRPKTGFTLPMGDWMRGEMRESCEAAIGQLERVSFLEGAEVRRIWNSFVTDSRSVHWSRPLALVVLGSAIG